jgi:hypothetical protein
MGFDFILSGFFEEACSWFIRNNLVLLKVHWAYFD